MTVTQYGRADSTFKSICMLYNYRRDGLSVKDQDT